jgi:hypothetical protein
MGGAIIGKCPVCLDHIWESDEWTMGKYFMKHHECDSKLMDDLTLKLSRLTRTQKIRIYNFLDSIIDEE